MTFFKNFSTSANMTALVIIAVVAALVALAAIIAVIIGKGDDLQKSMKSVSGSVESITGTVSNVQENVKKTQMHADGVVNYAGGKTWVGEAGPELVTLPQGSSIIPEKQVGKTEYNTFYVTIDAKNVDDFNKVVALAQQQRMAERRLAY